MNPSFSMISRLSIRTYRPLCIRYTSTSTSTTSPTPPLLVKIRNDLKTAMRTKDTSRLSVLRSLLTETLNKSKTSHPIQTDLHLLKLIRTSIKTSQSAASEFKANGREDLAAKEEQQVAVLEEYAGSVETVGEEEVRQVMLGVVEKLREEGKVEISQKDRAGVRKAVMGSFGDRLLEGWVVGKVLKDVLPDEKAS